MVGLVTKYAGGVIKGFALIAGVYPGNVQGPVNMSCSPSPIRCIRLTLSLVQVLCSQASCSGSWKERPLNFTIGACALLALNI